jgi:hypothetical protein
MSSEKTPFELRVEAARRVWAAAVWLLAAAAVLFLGLTCVR